MTPAEKSILDARASIPGHVVYRSFARETVVLNLHTGRYHGLNATAAEMLDALDRADTVRDAAAIVAERHAQAHDVVERDISSLCRDLRERGLMELAPADA